MINALVITHGEVGRELVRVVEMILGPVEGLVALSNSGRSVQDLVAAIHAALAEARSGDEDEALLFIDDFGGSCANASQIAVAEGETALVLTGTNLAMLLDFVTWRETLDAGELARRLVEKGRAAVTVLPSVKED